MKTVLVVSKEEEASVFLAKELSLLIEEQESEDEIEEYDFNPRGMAERPPTDDEIASADVILTPFSETDFSSKAKVPLEKEEAGLWADFFASVRVAGKRVVPFFDFKANRYVPMERLAERVVGAP